MATLNPADAAVAVAHREAEDQFAAFVRSSEGQLRADQDAAYRHHRAQVDKIVAEAGKPCRGLAAMDAQRRAASDLLARADAERDEAVDAAERDHRQRVAAERARLFPVQEAAQRRVVPPAAVASPTEAVEPPVAPSLGAKLKVIAAALGRDGEMPITSAEVNRLYQVAIATATGVAFSLVKIPYRPA
jgi:hypothetical protein